MVLHKRKITIISSALGDCVYVVFVQDVGYVRSKSAWNVKPTNIPDHTDYYQTLVDIARKAA